MELNSFTVRVPATSANLGPGFDALGMALGVVNTVRVEPGARVEVLVEGEGAGELPAGADNLVYRALAVVAERLGAPPPPVRLRCANSIPLARGLGSSSAAIVAGLLAGNRLLGGRLAEADLLALAVEIEGHPDNVTPALLGGVRVCVEGECGLVQAAVPMMRPLEAVLFVPDAPMSTAAARRLLPAAVPFADAVYNLGRAALLVAGLAGGDYTVLAEATRDRLHQSARSALFPAMSAFFAAALDAGALGAFLSGAGSALLALVEPDASPTPPTPSGPPTSAPPIPPQIWGGRGGGPGPALPPVGASGPAEAVAAAFQAVARREGVSGRTLVTAAGGEGARVLP